MNDNEKHHKICEKCRKGWAFHFWMCLKCERTGWGMGCPEHAHEEDKSVLV